MTSIDLRKDATAIQSMLKDAVQRYVARNSAVETADNHPPVSRIDLAFSLGDSESIPWVHLHFDTKTDAEPDGNPTHPDFAKSARKDWLPAMQAVCEDEQVTVVGHDGDKQLCGDAELTDAIGNFLVAMLLQARSEGVFASLPTAERCELGVEDPFSGTFGWPRYEDRGTINRL